MGIAEKKVTPQEVEAEIASIFFFTAEDGIKNAALMQGLPYDINTPLLEGVRRFTICIVVLKNGFIVHGTNSCVSPEIWKEDLGRQMAKEDALEKVWTLLGYKLKDQLNTGRLE